jgi:hypothetical protein
MAYFGGKHPGKLCSVSREAVVRGSLPGEPSRSSKAVAVRTLREHPPWQQFAWLSAVGLAGLHWTDIRCEAARGRDGGQGRGLEEQP